LRYYPGETKIASRVLSQHLQEFLTIDRFVIALITWQVL